MCGIVGCALKRRASDIIYAGLRQLEYRGYDSAGIATLSKGQISIVKRQGKVIQLENCIGELCGNTGIGHTRWATHGKPTDANAHPHAAGKFVIVHNGIIENFAELKEKYLSSAQFYSDTDSEVIVKLLDKFYDGNLLLTMKKVCSLLSGSYAIAVICADFDGIAVAKYKSPVIVGSGADGNFAASDAPALAGVCKEITVLEDNDFALVTSGGVRTFDWDLNEIPRPVRKNLATPANLELGGCPHYMLKEIRESPYAIANTCASFHSVESRLKKICAGTTRVILTGCGTAYNSGLVAKRYIEQFARIPCEAEIAGEFRYKNPVITGGTLIIAISQSGETADTVEAARLAKSCNARVIAVTNAPYSQLTQIADTVVPVSAGPEICVAATKSYAGQIAALYLLANILAGRENNFDEIIDVSRQCKNTVENTDISAIADMCARSNGVYFLGRDIDYAVALEGSLKLKEVSYIPSEGYPAGELKHGTLALIDENAVAVIVITCEHLAGKAENAVEQVLSRKGKVAIITCFESVAEKFENRAEIVKICDCGDLSPLISSAVLQMVAYKTALLLKRDPDKPRNLAKSVTVE